MFDYIRIACAVPRVEVGDPAQNAENTCRWIDKADGEMLRWLAQEPGFTPVREAVLDVVATPISPELLPPDEKGKISQQTEDLVGPYALHDFFLFHMLSFGFTPTKIYTLACRAFAGEYDGAVIKKWLRVFYRRFLPSSSNETVCPMGSRPARYA